MYLNMENFSSKKTDVPDLLEDSTKLENFLKQPYDVYKNQNGDVNFQYECTKVMCFHQKIDDDNE